MSDNELDNLFKEAAEGFTPPPDPSAWPQMASMLDKVPVKPGGFWNWKTISGLTATGLIAVTALWYSIEGNRGIKTNEQYESNNATQGVVQEQKEQTNPSGKENLAAAKPLENEDANESVVTARKDANKKNGFEQRKQNPAQAKSRHGTPEKVNALPRHNSDHIKSGKKEKGKSESAREQLVSGVDPQRDESVTGHEDADRKPVITTQSPVESPETQSALQAEPTESDSAAIAVETVKRDSVTDSSELKDEKKEKNIGAMRLSVKATVSPDFSSINFFSAGKTGFNYGILTGISFNNRWSVYTGVISSRKLYDTKDVSGNYSLNGHDYPMKAIDGDCRILDIPVNVYYTFFPERSFSLRAGLGFSSYIMRTENYRYLVDYYGHDAYYNKNVKGENNEWFKVMNISVVVSKKLSDRFSAEFEPFVKAPLAGVGEGKVSLVSMGAFINLRYDLLILK